MSRKTIRFGVMLACPLTWLWALPGMWFTWKLKHYTKDN